MKDFENRVAVVTGAASGIGRAMSETFLNAGMKVVLSDVDEQTLESTIKALREKGATVLGVATDVSKADQVAALADKAVQTFGAVHVLCNNAGVSCSQPNSWEIPVAGWQWVLGVNLMGVVHGIQSFLPVMLEQSVEGHIVNTASISGLSNDFVNTPYCISKHAVIVLSENLHLELQAKNANIKVSVLCPGPINTNIKQSVERNRPDNITLPTEVSEEYEVYKKAFQLWLQRGLDPLEVGRQVFDAIKNEQFYIITHNYADPGVQARMQSIIDRKNPELPPLPEEFISLVNEILGSTE